MTGRAARAIAAAAVAWAALATGCGLVDDPAAEGALAAAATTTEPQDPNVQGSFPDSPVVTLPLVVPGGISLPPGSTTTLVPFGNDPVVGPTVTGPTTTAALPKVNIPPLVPPSTVPPTIPTTLPPERTRLDLLLGRSEFCVALMDFAEVGSDWFASLTGTDVPRLRTLSLQLLDLAQKIVDTGSPIVSVFSLTFSGSRGLVAAATTRQAVISAMIGILERVVVPMNNVVRTTRGDCGWTDWRSDLDIAQLIVYLRGLV